MSLLHLVADVINHHEEMIQKQPVRSINANNIGNRLCLHHFVSVVKFIAERGLTIRDDENVGLSRKFFQKFSKLFSSKYLKKEVVMLLTISFATVSQTANPCQILCCIIKFCYG